MQPAPTEASQTATSVESTHTTTPPIQHGQPESQQQTPSHLFHEDVGASAIDRPDDTDAASISSGGASRGRQPNTGRISSRNDSSQESSPGSRIDEYERAHATVRKPSGGMIFQVVPSARSTNVSIQEFPNGMLLVPLCVCLLTFLQRS